MEVCILWVLCCYIFNLRNSQYVSDTLISVHWCYHVPFIQFLHTFLLILKIVKQWYLSLFDISEVLCSCVTDFMVKTGSFSGRFVQWTMQKVSDILRNLLDHTALIDACGRKTSYVGWHIWFMRPAFVAHDVSVLTYHVYPAKHSRLCDRSGRTITRYLQWSGFCMRNVHVIASVFPKTSR